MDTVLLAYIVSAVLLAVHAYVTVWFVVSLITRRNDVADIAWGLGISLVAMTALVLADEPSFRLNLMAALMFFWGTRLSTHIYKRFSKHPLEDYRYATWRKNWRLFMPRSYAQVFLLQGLLMVIVGYSAIHVAASPASTVGLLDVVAVLVWIMGYLIEGKADRQLRAFVADPTNHGKVLDTGLWRYSRHPNYFGEVMQWWGIWFFALATPYGWVAIVSPLMITILILKVSGVPLLERSLERNVAYQEYQKRTSVLIPLPPKK